MTPDEWERVTELFEAALERHPGTRSEFVAGASAGNALIETEVKRLLAAEEHRSSGFLKSSAWRHMPVAQDSSALIPQLTPGAPETAGTLIGRYQLLKKIGEGGMGEVWLAEQKEPVRRRVALKLVKAGMNTREVMARFDSERQALALMDHPAIAKVLDAGSTSRGTPYFVMEYVEGVPITTYCDEHRLGTGERLVLFIHVCEGVQHAHQKAIIHRDLKPSNILVTEVDGHSAPKIIDFGVAKALGQRLTEQTLYTRAGMLLGTLPYMSPEQALSSGEDIDTRTDVYSLGVILYELLAGAPPIELRRIAWDESLRRLREEEPLKPSTKVRTQDLATSADVARNRGTELPTLARQLRGDLDLIALKALEKDRSRRYGSPSDFASDIGRTLRHEPVLAVPPSIAYRARKFARRYRAALVTVAAFALVLIAAAAISVWQSVRATRQRDRADAETAVAEAISNFLRNDVLAQASAATQSGPTAKPDPDLKVRTALDRAAARIKGKFAGQPEVEAAIRETIGQTYIDLGLYDEARKQLEHARDLHVRALGAKNPKTIKTESTLGHTAELQGKYLDAEALLSQALAIQSQVLGPQHPDTLMSMSRLASVYTDQSKYPQAEALDSQVSEIRSRVLGPEHPDTLNSMNNLAVDYSKGGKHPQAERIYSQILEIERRVLGPEHPDTLASMSNLAADYDDAGKYPQAEALNSKLLEIQRRVLGPEHPDTLVSMGNLAADYSDAGKYPEAEALGSELLGIQRRVLGPEHPDTLVSMSNLAEAYNNEGKYTQAEALARQTVEISRRVLGPGHFVTLVNMENLANSYGAQGEYAQAEVLYNQALAIARKELGPENPVTLSALSGLAFMYRRKGNLALAETYAAQVLAARRRALGPENADTTYSEVDLALAYVSQGKFGDAEPLAREALETERKIRPNGWQRYRAGSLLGASLAGEKKYPEAEPLLLEGYQGMLARKDRISVPDRYNLNLARQWVIELYQSWGKPAKAAEWSKN
jgi:tetratricopeptide (TPR) repeat protein